MNSEAHVSPVELFFKRASDNGKANFVFTLVRAEGMTRERKDPFLEAEEIFAVLSPELHLERLPPAEAVEVLRNFTKLLKIREIYDFLFNLARCVKGEAYLISPFGHLGSGQFPNYQPPPLREVLNALYEKAVEVREELLPDFVSLLLSDALAPLFIAEDFAIRESVIVAAPTNELVNVVALTEPLSQVLAFYQEMFNAYRRFRLEFKKLPRFYKWPDFMVCELLVSEDVGLYGFRVHSDSGSASTVSRGPDWTDAINLGFTDNQLAFYAGILDNARREWMVGDKRACEIGLAGRYNERGCWKPIIHPGATDAIQRDVGQASADNRVRGVLFYMYSSGHRGIELAAKATVELPGDLRFPSGIELYKCHSDVVEGVWIYDGWLELADTSPETISKGLAEIERTMRRLAFAYDVNLRWCLKYEVVRGGVGWAQPSEEDLPYLGALSAVPSDEDAQRVLDGVVDWYQSGRGAYDAGTRYLCHWIALESLAVALFDGELRGHYGELVPQAERQAAMEEARREIQGLYEQLYSRDPIDFVTQAYFNAVPDSIGKKTKAALRMVFGEQSDILERVYGRRDGYSLADIRHHLAHGRFSMWNREHAELVAQRAGELGEIAKEFIVRVLLRLRPEEPTPQWTLQYVGAFSFDDPRSCLVASHERMFPTTDWRIRAAWIR